MTRFHPLRAALGGLVLLILLGLIVLEIKRRVTPRRPSGRVPIEFRIVADPEADPVALGPLAGAEGLGQAPAGYRWVKVGDPEAVRPDPRSIVRADPKTGEPHVLVKLDPHNLTEKQIAALYLTHDEREKAAIGFTLDPDGAKRLGALTRENLPDPKTGDKHRLAIIIGDAVITAPSINSEIRDAGIIEGGSKGFDDAEARRLIETLTHLLVLDADPAGSDPE